MPWQPRTSVLLFLLGTFVSDSVYHDPASFAQMKKSADHRHNCSSGSSNGVHEEETVASKSLESRLNMTTWADDYAAAMRVRSQVNTTLLAELSSRPAYKLPAAFHQGFFDFIQLKDNSIVTLERRAGLDELWQPGMRILDGGTGHGFLSGYLQARHRVLIKGYDVADSYQCKEIMASPLKVHFFDGRTLPEPARSFDAVTFMFVLHHAANSTRSLLESAASISRRWIVILEDTDNGTPGIKERNRKHDPNGIFRNDEAWKALFAEACPDFHLVSDGLMPGRATIRYTQYITTSEHAESRKFQRWYTLERRARVISAARTA